jgi:Pin2-interacting protein X1
MGLSEPRKRLKLSHDPRNLAWASSTGASDSVGHRLMISQGWSEGQALGARTPSSHSSGTSTPTAADDHARLAAARVGVLFKDDTLGLGAKLKSRDVEGQKTGLDAFQGLLGRLNSKTVEEEKAHERKMENQKLEGYARGRWGGMMFVPGGVLVQGEAFKSKKEAMEAEQKREEEESASLDSAELPENADVQGDFGDEKAERRRRKDERRQRKEDRRAQKAAKALKAVKKDEHHATHNLKPSKRKSSSNNISAPDEPTSSSSDDSPPPAESTTTPDSNRSRRRPSITVTDTKKTEILRNGRHILRGRNIEAKRRAFSDMKGLDAIFMK